LTFWHETQDARALAACIELVDVHPIAKVDAVGGAGDAADDIEVVEYFKLISLAGRQVLLQETQTLPVGLSIG
jgi:hypothetical protein